MIKKYLNKLSLYAVICAAFVLTTHVQNLAQVNGPQQQQFKQLRVSALHSWFSSAGAEIEYGRRGRSCCTNFDQLDGLNWPGEYSVNKGVLVGKGLWIGTTNYDDPVSGRNYPYKVIAVGRNAMEIGTAVIADEISMAGKFDHPSLLVDDNFASDLDYDDDVDDPDNPFPDISADRVIINKFHTSIGISCTRRILAFSQQYHNNYYITEYEFVNTGIIDMSKTPKQTKKLTGVRFHFQHRYGFAGEAYLPQNSWAPNGAAWGLNTVNDAIGQDADHLGTAPNDFRAVWSYYGPAATPVADNLGLPKATDGSILAGTCFAGVVVLHADKSTKDHSDDRQQPSTTWFQGSDRGDQGASQYDASLMARQYANHMVLGHPERTHAEQLGKDANGWPTGVASNFQGDGGGISAAQGFGPYDIEPGDTVRIILAEGVAGIMSDRDFVKEIAKNWYDNAGGPYQLPDGSTTTNRNTYKNTWVFTGKDSLFQTFRRAIANYRNNYKIPEPPRPPSEFKVTSSSDRIRLSWSEDAENLSPNGVNGYLIYRAEERQDTTYDLIFACYANKEGYPAGTPAGLVHSYDDKTAKRGFNYYYFIQSIDNGSANPGDAALNIPANEPLVSSKYYTMTNREAHLTRPYGSANTTTTKAIFNGDGVNQDFDLPLPLSATRGISVYINGDLQMNSRNNIIYSIVDSTKIHFTTAPTGTIEVNIFTPTGTRSYGLSEIKIVPNPYNIKAKDLQFGQESPDKLAFYNLPPFCKIKIYTETGDLIETLDHTNGSGDEFWHSLTSSRQLVVSGLYIAFFEVTQDTYDEASGALLYRQGDNTYKKFIIIR